MKYLMVLLGLISISLAVIAIVVEQSNAQSLSIGARVIQNPHQWLKVDSTSSQSLTDLQPAQPVQETADITILNTYEVL